MADMPFSSLDYYKDYMGRAMGYGDPQNHQGQILGNTLGTILGVSALAPFGGKFWAPPAFGFLGSQFDPRAQQPMRVNFTPGLMNQLLNAQPNPNSPISIMQTQGATP